MQQDHRAIKLSIVTSITLSRFGLAVIVLWCAYYSLWLVILTCAIVAFASDWLDGKLARQWGIVSAFGKFFDPLGDKAICLCLLWLLAIHVSSLLLGSCAVLMTLYDGISTSLRLLIKHTTGTMNGASHVAKAKTAALMSGLLILIAAIIVHAQPTVFILLQNSGIVLICIATLLALYSLWIYLNQAFKHPTVVKCYPDIAAIDFSAWQQRGISTLLIDVEGTLTAWGDDTVAQSAVDALAAARRAGIRHCVLITNIQPVQEARVKQIAAQITAEFYFLPKQFSQRKPSPYMLRQALSILRIPADQTMMIGDKLVDVIAAKRAGLRAVAWVNRFGETDLPLDRYFYRPLEPFLKWLLS